MRTERRTTLVIGHTWDGEPIAANERASVALALGAETLVVEVAAPFHGDPPPPGPAACCEGLWEFEVVEIFLVGEDERYLELELSPHGHYLALLLHQPRQVTRRGVELAYSSRRDAGRWQGRAELPIALLPPGLSGVNAFAIHGVDSHRRYLAAHPTRGEQPDFHRIACFPSLEW